MHVLFGISALIMLAGTLWMLAKDHNREWRQWQLDDRSREAWTIQAQLAQSQADSKVALQRLNADLETARSTKVEGSLIQDFEGKVTAEEQRLAKEGSNVAPANFKKLNDAASRMEAAQDSGAIQSARQAAIDEMNNNFIREAKRREGCAADEEEIQGS